MILITGAGRSGTKYIATVLQRCGLDVRHEQLGRDGIVSGFYCFEAESYPGKQPAPRPHFDTILHQVRHPLQSIASIRTGRSRKWAQQFVDVEAEASPLRWASAYWLTWNLAAEQQALSTYRIEDLRTVWPYLQYVLGFRTAYESIADVPQNLHTRKHGAVAWGDVQRAAPEFYADIREAAWRYGYKVEED